MSASRLHFVQLMLKHRQTITLHFFVYSISYHSCCCINKLHSTVQQFPFLCTLPFNISIDEQSNKNVRKIAIIMKRISFCCFGSTLLSFNIHCLICIIAFSRSLCLPGVSPAPSFRYMCVCGCVCVISAHSQYLPARAVVILFVDRLYNFLFPWNFSSSFPL